MYIELVDNMDDSRQKYQGSSTQNMVGANDHFIGPDVYISDYVLRLLVTTLYNIKKLLLKKIIYK